MDKMAGPQIARAQKWWPGGPRPALGNDAGAYDEAVRAVRAGELDADAAAGQLIDRMTDRELLGLLDGDSPDA